ncbi:hypothetical protein FPV67DRAFT_1444205 [Lyophyllum atratum]|nr:hypothetical protein FPV67DRAFT_1444205 [Lyophyllum atratum]
MLGYMKINRYLRSALEREIKYTLAPPYSQTPLAYSPTPRIKWTLNTDIAALESKISVAEGNLSALVLKGGKKPTPGAKGQQSKARNALQKTKDLLANKKSELYSIQVEQSQTIGEKRGPSQEEDRDPKKGRRDDNMDEDDLSDLSSIGGGTLAGDIEENQEGRNVTSMDGGSVVGGHVGGAIVKEGLDVKGGSSAKMERDPGGRPGLAKAGSEEERVAAVTEEFGSEKSSAHLEQDVVMQDDVRDGNTGAVEGINANDKGERKGPPTMDIDQVTIASDVVKAREVAVGSVKGDVGVDMTKLLSMDDLPGGTALDVEISEMKTGKRDEKKGMGQEENLSGDEVVEVEETAAPGKGKEKSKSKKGKEKSETASKKERKKTIGADDESEGSGDEQEKPSAKTNEKLYEDLSEDEKENLPAKARKEFRLFLKKGTPVGSGLRRMIRENQWLLPESATISRELALHILGSTHANTQCLFHRETKAEGKKGGFTKGIVLTGTPGPRLVKSKNMPRPKAPAEGLLHCGCEEDKALLDFIFWKTWKATYTSSYKKSYTEGLATQRLEPRSRMFMVHAVEEYSGLKLDDFYTGPGNAEDDDEAEFPNFFGPEHQRKMVRSSLIVLMERLQVYNSILGGLEPFGAAMGPQDNEQAKEAFIDPTLADQ